MVAAKPGQTKTAKQTRAALQERRPGPPTKQSFMERRELIRELIITIGFENINKTQLAHQFKVGRKTIYEDLQMIMRQIPKEELEREKSKAYYDFLNVDRRLGRIMEDNKHDPDLQLRAIETKTKSLERKAKVFESFGLKEKVADVVAVESVRNELTVEDFQRAYEARKKKESEDDD